MGLNTWAAFAGTDADAMVAGDVAMLEHEVTPVLKALRANGLDVVAIHHHMTGVKPPCRLTTTAPGRRPGWRGVFARRWICSARRPVASECPTLGAARCSDSRASR